MPVFPDPNLATALSPRPPSHHFTRNLEQNPTALPAGHLRCLVKDGFKLSFHIVGTENTACPHQSMI